jgi:hypothetical protein
VHPRASVEAVGTPKRRIGITVAVHDAQTIAVRAMTKCTTGSVDGSAARGIGSALQ